MHASRLFLRNRHWPQDMASYRPRSGFSFLSKLIERLILFRHLSHVTDFNLLSPSQSAYRTNYLTETALLPIQNDLLVAADAGFGSALLLLNLSAAFDTVDHCILIERMATTFGVSGSALNWFRSYLSSRTQSAKALGVTSLPVPLLFGVPQESVLGPSLFNIYTSPIPAIAAVHGVKVSSPTTPKGTSTSTLILIIGRLWLLDLSPPVLRISRTGLRSIA